MLEDRIEILRGWEAMFADGVLAWRWNLVGGGDGGEVRLWGEGRMEKELVKGWAVRLTRDEEVRLLRWGRHDGKGGRDVRAKRWEGRRRMSWNQMQWVTTWQRMDDLQIFVPFLLVIYARVLRMKRVMCFSSCVRHVLSSGWLYLI